MCPLISSGRQPSRCSGWQRAAAPQSAHQQTSWRRRTRRWGCGGEHLCVGGIMWLQTTAAAFMQPSAGHWPWLVLCWHVHCALPPPSPACPPQTMLGAHMVNNPMSSDVTFVVEGRPFLAHKVQLLNSSEIFRTMFDGHYREKVRCSGMAHHVGRAMLSLIQAAQRALSISERLFGHRHVRCCPEAACCPSLGAPQDAATIPIPNVRWEVWEKMMYCCYTGEAAPPRAAQAALGQAGAVEQEGSVLQRGLAGCRAAHACLNPPEPPIGWPTLLVCRRQGGRAPRAGAGAAGGG